MGKLLKFYYQLPKIGSSDPVKFCPGVHSNDPQNAENFMKI